MNIKLSKTHLIVLLSFLISSVVGFLIGSYMMYSHLQPKLNKSKEANIVAVGIIDNWKELAHLEAEKYQNAVKALTTECTIPNESCNAYGERVKEIKVLEDKNQAQTYPMEMQLKELVIEVSRE